MRTELALLQQLSDPPGSQLSVQNLAEAPSPSEIAEAALNIAETAFSVVSGSKCHGLGCSSHFIHDHRHRRAHPNHLRLRTPSPPQSLGAHTCAHGSKQWPPLMASSPFHMKPRHLLLIILMAQTGRGKTAMKWIGRAMSTELTSVSLPAAGSNFGFQPFILLEYLSTRGMTSCLLNLKTERGSPRYVIGKDFC